MRGDYLDSRRGDGAIELDPFGYDRFSTGIPKVPFIVTKDGSIYSGSLNLAFQGLT